MKMFCGAGMLVLLAGVGGAGVGDAREDAQVDRSVDASALMTKGKLEADLGNHTAASETFRAIAQDSAAPAALVWEALVRLGLTLSASDDALGSAQTFRRVLQTYSGDPAAMRFLKKAVASAVPGKIWLDFRADFEELLRSAQVVSTEKLGMLASGVRKIRLAQGEIEFDAVWKVLPRVGGESHLKTVAAYELDKLLGLDMVPPTILRALEGQQGSLQLWVYGCRAYGDVQKDAPQTAAWAHRVSRMKTFDYLIGNLDRTVGNILVDQSWDLVLLDHLRSFTLGQMDSTTLPARFDRHLVDRIRSLNEAGLGVRLHGLLDRPEIEGILKRRDAILDHVEKLVAREGQGVLF